MTHEMQRKFLIEELLKEEKDYRDVQIPADAMEQKKLLRSLMNVRPPRAISEQFLKIQDAYLKDEQTSIVDVDGLLPSPLDERLYLWQGDITTLKVDAIVNAANSGMCGCFHPLHSCVDNIIHSRSGIELRLYCAKLMQKQGHEEPTGQAKITPAFNLPSSYVLHTVGPIIYERVRKEDEELLASCYRSCLSLAAEHGLSSIAFCCISTGEFRFPNERAAEIAIHTVREFLQKETSIKKVIFNVFKDLDREIYERLLGTDRKNPQRA